MRSNSLDLANFIFLHMGPFLLHILIFFFPHPLSVFFQPSSIIVSVFCTYCKLDSFFWNCMLCHAIIEKRRNVHSIQYTINPDNECVKSRLKYKYGFLVCHFSSIGTKQFVYYWKNFDSKLIFHENGVMISIKYLNSREHSGRDITICRA